MAHHALRTAPVGLVIAVLALTGCEEAAQAGDQSIVGTWNIVALGHTDWPINERQNSTGISFDVLQLVLDQGTSDVVLKIDAGGRAVLECTPTCGATDLLSIKTEYTVNTARKQVQFKITEFSPAADSYIGYTFNGRYYFPSPNSVRFTLDSMDSNEPCAGPAGPPGEPGPPGPPGEPGARAAAAQAREECGPGYESRTVLVGAK